MSKKVVSSLANVFLKGMVFALGMCVTGVAAVVVGGEFNTFESAQVVSAAQINANFLSLKTAVESTVEPPVGSIVAWHKDLTNVPALPAGWLECNGQTVGDTASVLNGVTLPDLNGSRHFLRGNASSGGVEGSQNLSHTHASNIIVRSTHVNASYVNSAGGAGLGNLQGVVVHNNINGATNPNVAYTGIGESRPVNMSVVWIIRVR